MSKHPNTRQGWWSYLRDSLASINAANASLAQVEFAKYEMGGRILDAQEFMEPMDYECLLFDLRIAPSMQADYKRRFLAEVTSYVNKSAF